MAKIDITKTELVCPGKYNKPGHNRVYDLSERFPAGMNLGYPREIR